MGRTKSWRTRKTLRERAKSPWVEIPPHTGDRACDVWPEESIAQWHERLGAGALNPEKTPASIFFAHGSSLLRFSFG